MKNIDLKKRFDARGFGVNKYAKAYGLSQPILSNVLNDIGETTGTNRSRSGVTRKVYAQLKKDDVYIGALPWEVKR